MTLTEKLLVLLWRRPRYYSEVSSLTSADPKALKEAYDELYGKGLTKVVYDKQMSFPYEGVVSRLSPVRLTKKGREYAKRYFNEYERALMALEE
jgi:hypothetical protein